MYERLRRRLERVRLTRASLVRMAFAIFGGFIAVAVILSALRPAPSLGARALSIYLQHGPADGERRLVEHLRESPEDGETWLELAQLRTWAAEGVLPWIPEPEESVSDTRRLPPNPSVESGTYLSDAEFDAFLASCPIIPVEILRAWRDARRLGAALRHLEAAPASIEHLLAGGEICLESSDPRAPGRAIDWFSRARGVAPADSRATSGWLRALERAGLDAEVEAALADPAVRALADPRVVFEHHRERGEYLRGAVPLWRSQYRHYDVVTWIACLVTGACWGVLLFHLALGWHWRRSLQALVPIALLLGWFSVDATILAVVITDDRVGEGAREQFPSSIAYALLIGLREEVIKLLFFLPLVPYLARRGSDVQALAIAALVGLGFAMQENANYFLGGGGDEVIARYITANFAHQALTGFVGYHLVRAVRIGGGEWGEFFRILVLMIVVHGAYDLFIIDPTLGDYSILSIVIFIILSQRFLRLAFRLRPHRIQRLSLTRIFVAALATVTGMNYLYLTTRLGIGAALWETLGGFLGVALLGFLYFQEFDERVA